MSGRKPQRNPQRIQTRTHLLDFIQRNAPSSAVRRAVNEGRVNVLGAFASLPPHVHPGFIVNVTSKHGRTWPVCVLVNDIRHRYEVYILDQIPWSLWEGGNTTLYAGDNPVDAQNMRDYLRGTENDTVLGGTC